MGCCVVGGRCPERVDQVEKSADGMPTLSRRQRIVQFGASHIPARVKRLWGARRTPKPIQSLSIIAQIIVADFVPPRVDVNEAQAHKTVVNPNGRLKMRHRGSHEIENEMRDAFDYSVEADLEVTKATSSSLTCIPMTNARSICSNHKHAEIKNTTVIEFDAPEVSVFGNHDGGVGLWVWRLGDLEGPLVCEWELKNGSFPKKYLRTIPRTKGTISFEDGEDCFQIWLELGSTDTCVWTVDCFCIVNLVPQTGTPSLGSRVVTGRNSDCHVWVMNKETFPPGLTGKPGGLKLVFAFWRYNFWLLPRASMAGLIVSIIPAISNFGYLSMLEQLVDCAESETCYFGGVSFDDNWTWTPMGYIGTAYALLLLLDYLGDRAFRTRRLGGRATRTLRVNLFSKMIQLDESAWMDFDRGEIPRIINNDITKAIDEVWLGGFRLFSCLCELIVRFAILEQVLQLTLYSFLPHLCRAGIFFMCLAAALTFIVTQREYVLLDSYFIRAFANWHAFVEMCEECFTAIKAFRRHGETIVSADEAHGMINKTFIRWQDYTETWRWRAKFVFQLVFVAIAVVMGQQARSGAISTGNFVVVLRSVESFSKGLDGFTAGFMKLFAGASAIEKVATVLNRDTSRRRPDPVVTERRYSSPAFPKRVRQELHMNQVVFRYPYSTERVIKPLSFRINPGKIICIPKSASGQTTAGVNTFFKLIAGELQPLSGSVDMPARWRVAYISNTPVIFDGDLLYNLSYGSAFELSMEDVNLVWETCRAVGLNEKLIGKASFDVGSNGSHLAFSDRLRVVLVRAILNDADLILIASLLDIIGFQKATQLFIFLREYIRTRGMPGITTPKTFRPQKTFVYSSASEEIQRMSDMLLTKNDTGILHTSCHDASVRRDSPIISSAEEVCEVCASSDLPPPPVGSITIDVSAEQANIHAKTAL
eukprot:TRINITY_DN15723_c0_g1_i1.p1 TRINITY_DN15723_c0_g1~~TRINITY_DN15723_c0_g1_i1.p1  ORF type:complete len:932 (-),score=93.11 TRINITY_DN15723_c0_g1_i1:49-2844(-)